MRMVLILLLGSNTPDSTCNFVIHRRSHPIPSIVLSVAATHRRRATSPLSYADRRCKSSYLWNKWSAIRMPTHVIASVLGNIWNRKYITHLSLHFLSHLNPVSNFSFLFRVHPPYLQQHVVEYMMEVTIYLPKTTPVSLIVNVCE